MDLWDNLPFPQGILAEVNAASLLHHERYLENCAKAFFLFFFLIKSTVANFNSGFTNPGYENLDFPFFSPL